MWALKHWSYSNQLHSTAIYEWSTITWNPIQSRSSWTSVLCWVIMIGCMIGLSCNCSCQWAGDIATQQSWKGSAKQTVSAWQSSVHLLHFLTRGIGCEYAMFVFTWITNEMKFVRSLGTHRTLHCHFDITKFMLIRTLESPSNNLP